MSAASTRRFSSSAAGISSVAELNVGETTGKAIGNDCPSRTSPTSNSVTWKLDSSMTMPRSWISSRVSGRETTVETRMSSKTVIGTVDGVACMRVAPVSVSTSLMSFRLYSPLTAKGGSRSGSPGIP